MQAPQEYHCALRLQPCKLIVRCHKIAHPSSPNVTTMPNYKTWQHRSPKPSRHSSNAQPSLPHVLKSLNQGTDTLPFFHKSLIQERNFRGLHCLVLNIQSFDTLHTKCFQAKKYGRGCDKQWRAYLWRIMTLSSSSSRFSAWCCASSFIVRRCSAVKRLEVPTLQRHTKCFSARSRLICSGFSMDVITQQ